MATQPLDVQTPDIEKQNHAFRNAALAGTATVGTLALASPSNAQSTGVADISAEVTSLGGLAATALAVALTPFAIFYGLKIVKRVMSNS